MYNHEEKGDETKPEWFKSEDGGAIIREGGHGVVKGEREEAKEKRSDQED